MPILQAMKNYAQADVYPLHTPGHKGGRCLNREYQHLLGPAALAIDVSLMQELDDLHAPEGCIALAQQLAAETFGADKSFFAVNGTSGALQALLLGSFQPGDKLLIARNMHRSLLAALVLANYQVRFLQPEYQADFAISLQVKPEQVAQALAQEPDIKGVLLTSPNYYGLSADIAQIAQITHAYGAVLLVDEAHGAHLGFSEKFPAPALSLGADAVAQSTHKSLSSLTQTSMLHLKSARLDYQRITAMMSMLTTTSPNYLLLASLDAARYLMQTQGAELLERAWQMANKLRQQLKAIPGLTVLELQDCAGESVVSQDISKILLKVSGLGYTGVEFGQLLRQAGYAVELVDAHNVLLLLSYAEEPSRLAGLVQVIRALPQRSPKSVSTLPKLELPERGFDFGKAFYAPRERVLFKEAVGRIAAESIVFYPPGIACILPGEILSKYCLQYCQQMVQLGVAVTGCQDSSLQYLEVLKES